MNYAISNDIIIKNPCIGVKFSKKENRKRRVMDAREQAIFEEEIENTIYEMIYKTALLTGMGIG